MTLRTTVTPYGINRCIQNLRVFHDTYLQHLKHLQDLMLSADGIMEGDDFKIHVEVCADCISEVERHPSLFEHAEYEVNAHIARGVTVYQNPRERKHIEQASDEPNYEDIPF